MKNKILILGSGFMSGAVVHFLGENNKNSLTIASRVKEELEILRKKNGNVETVVLDVTRDAETLSKLVEDSDIVVSVLPTSLHVSIIKECIRLKKDFVHASYYSEEMRELKAEVEKAGIIVFNEIGLDPGIDHLLAMKYIDEIHDKGEKVKSFISYCGGLPAPEFSDNALRYKFSWTPRQALVNLLNGAKYLEGNEVVEVAPGGDLIDVASDIRFLPGFALEGYPNRDSLPYKTTYKIPEVENLLRGTLRYRGYGNSVKILKELGLLSMADHPLLNPNAEGNSTVKTWVEIHSLCSFNANHNVAAREFMSKLIGADLSASDEKLKFIFGNSDFQVIEDLGLLEDCPIIKCNTPLDTLSTFLTEKLAFEPHERDIVILRNEIISESSIGEQTLHEVNLVVYGEPANTGIGFSAMAKTVGATMAIATEMILSGEIEEKGMILPLSRSIYIPMLQRLAQKGITPFTMSKKLKI